MRGNSHVRFWIGGGGSNLPADHTKSARESVRSYHDSSERYSGRPDAELLYTLSGSTAVCHLLIEYDRGTTFAREYQDKFAAYSAYQHDMRTVLPRIVMITPNQQAADRIRRSIRQVHAQDVQVTIVLEQEVLQRGLLLVLGVQGSPRGSEETGSAMRRASAEPL